MAKKKATKKKTVKKATASKAIATKKDTAVAVVDSMVPEELQGMFDQNLMGAKVDKDDIIISKAWLLQQMSDAVTDDKHEAVAGEYRNSRTLELIAGKGESFEGIIIDNYKSWQCYEEDEKGEMQYTETLNYYEHSDLKFDSTNPVNNRAIHRDLVLGFFMLSMKEIEAGNAFPMILDFKRTSRGAGKDLSTSIAQLASKGVPSYGKVYSFGSEQKTKTNDKGKEFRYYVKTVDEGRWISKDELAVIVEWAKELAKKQQAGKVHVDDTDVKADNVSEEGVVETTATEVSGNSRF